MKCIYNLFFCSLLSGFAVSNLSAETTLACKSYSPTYKEVKFIHNSWPDGWGEIIRNTLVIGARLSDQDPEVKKWATTLIRLINEEKSEEIIKLANYMELKISIPRNCLVDMVSNPLQEGFTCDLNRNTVSVSFKEYVTFGDPLLKGRIFYEDTPLLSLTNLGGRNLSVFLGSDNLSIKSSDGSMKKSFSARSVLMRLEKAGCKKTATFPFEI